MEILGAVLFFGSLIFALFAIILAIRKGNSEKFESVEDLIEEAYFMGRGKGSNKFGYRLSFDRWKRERFSSGYFKGGFWKKN